jgi:murein L,D-transpeptidase YafK
MKRYAISLLLVLCFSLATLPSFAIDNRGYGLMPDEAAAPFDIEDVKAAKIVVYKAERRMDLFDKQGNPIRSYRVSLGKNPVGDKLQEGDGKTPEGKYYIDTRNPESRYHLSLRISYPNKSDLWRAKRLGVDPGGDIFIHGLPNNKSWMSWKYNKQKDWTDGCIAVNDKEIREIWEMVPDGIPIYIKP